MSEANSKEKTLIALYTEFNKYHQKGEYDRALKTINKVIQLSNDDPTGLECKVVCLIYLNRFEEAIQFIRKQGINMPFERAYCLYRTNSPEEALKIINEVQTPNHRILELKAQILYRLEQFSDALKVYDNIFRNDPDDEYDEERQTNLGAVVSSLNQAETDVYVSQLKEDTYEMCYNKALMYAKQESYANAEKMLKKAEVLLKEAFEEDGASEEETEKELTHIKVLQGFCCQKQGRMKEAHQIYLAVLKLKLDDISLSAVASNNVVVINKDQNVFDSKKKMKVATNESLIHKLPSTQRRSIALNNAIFKYYCNQHDQSEKACNLIAKEYPSLAVKAKILSAFNAFKADPNVNPIDRLKGVETKNNEDDLYLKLTTVHLLLTQGKKEQACAILEKLGDNRFKPGIIGALLTIYMNMGKEDVALKIYEEAIEWYKSNEKSGKDLTSFFKQAGEFHIRSGRPQVAAKSLEQLLAKNTGGAKTTAQLVVAYSQFDETKAIKLSSKLGSFNDLEKDVDTKNLESSIWLNAKKASSTIKVDSPGSTENTPNKRKHKKRKGKLPKNYDASATPDPERWLPKYERTGFRKKRDRRMKDIIKGSQGTTAGQSDQYDFSRNVQDDKEDSPASVDPSPMQKNTKQKKGNNQKKKNKRR